jgi:hypothetical protein
MPKSRNQKIRRIHDAIASLCRDVNALEVAVAELAGGDSSRDSSPIQLLTQYPHPSGARWMRQPSREQ